MSRVLFLSQRMGDSAFPSGGGSHLAATLAGLGAHFEVHAVTAATDDHAAGGGARALRRLVPPRVRGLRHDLLLAAADRAFARRAHAEGRAFRPDVVYERSEYFASAGLAVARALEVPLVLEVNGLFVDDARTMYRSLAEPLGGRLERRKHRAADAVVTVSTGLARRLIEWGADPERIVVVPNSIDPTRIAEPRPVAPGSGIVGFVGHLMPWYAHALELLVDAAPELLDAGPDVRFRVVGAGPGLDSLRARAAARGVGERFEFTGSVPQGRVPAEVARFDVGLVPPVFSYAFPVKLVEMGAAGVPVVAPQSRDLDEMLEPGVEYEPFAPDEPGSMTAALRRVLAEPERRARLGAALHAAVRARFTWEVSGNALAVAIERVLAER
ncbi:MAG: glycosyltransferase family 4 protein [Gaiellaceae bacterium]